MNSRQRVTAAIDGKAVDQVPMGFYAVDHDIIEKVIGRPSFVRNKIAIQIALWEGWREGLAEGLKKDTVEFYRKVDCADIILPKEAQLLPRVDYEPAPVKIIADDRWEDNQGRVYQAAYNANEFQCIHDLTATGKPGFTEEMFADRLDTTPPDPSVFEVLDCVIEELGEERYIASMTAGMTAMTLPGGSGKFHGHAR